MTEDTAAPKVWWSPSRRAVFAEVFPLRPQGSTGIFPLVPYYRDQDGMLPEDVVEIATKAATEARAVGEDPHHGYTCAENEALTDGLQGDVNTVSDVLVRRGHKVDLREHGIDHWVWEALEKAAAPPTLSAPGVAELLAEARRLIGWLGESADIRCTEIVHLLAPGGGQS